MTSEFSARDWVVELLTRPRERDQQVKVGASNLSNPCTYCLAQDMLGVPQAPNRYSMGALIGKAIHNEIDHSNTDPDTLGEQKVILGEIPGYGVVKSTSDLYHVPSRTVVDWKTTVKEKLKYLKRAVVEEPDDLEPTKVKEARFKVNAYINQTLLYGRDFPDVARCAIVFICRDGSTEDDIWEYSFDFNKERSDRVWDRGVRLWAWLTEGGDPETLPQHPHCYACATRS